MGRFISGLNGVTNFMVANSGELTMQNREELLTPNTLDVILHCHLGGLAATRWTLF